MESTYYKKYLKYRAKYLELKNTYSQFGGEQIGGTYCKACDKKHSGMCSFKLSKDKINDEYIEMLKITIEQYKNGLEFYKNKMEVYFLQIICNLETIIKMYFRKRNKRLWNSFLYFSRYIQDKIEYYNTFVAFYEVSENKMLFANAIQEFEKFSKFLQIATGLLIDEPEEEIQRMLRYLQKGISIYNIYSLREDDLTDSQLFEFNQFMNKYKLNNPNYIKYEEDEDFTTIPDLVLMVVKNFTQEQKKALLIILNEAPNINFHTAYELAFNNATEIDMQIFNILFEMFKEENEEDPFKLNILTMIIKEEHTWTEKDLADTVKLYRFFKFYKKITKLEEGLREYLEERSDYGVEYDDNEHELSLKLQEYRRILNSDIDIYDIPQIILKSLFPKTILKYIFPFNPDNPNELSPKEMSLKDKILGKPSFKPSFKPLPL